MSNEVLTKVGNKAEWAAGSAGGSVPKPLTYDYMPEGYPSKSGWSIEWDGNTDGLFSFLVEGKTFYKVSDMLPTADELIGATLEASSGLSHELESVDINAPNEDVTILPNKAWIVRKEMTAPDMTQLQKGTYFVLTDKYYISRLSKQTITPMAEEFLPTGIKELIMRSSTTDSTKKFKITVDDSGTLSAVQV